MADCGKKTAKYILFFINFLIWVAGGTLLGIGIYMRVGSDVTDIITIADSLTIYYSGCYALIAAGALMFFMGFVGCCGANKENRCLLGIYIAVISLIIIIEATVGIYAGVNKDNIEDTLKKAFNETLVHGDDPTDPITQSVIALQKNFKCCGLTRGCNDWKNGVSFGCACTPAAVNDSTCVLASSLNCTDGTALPPPPPAAAADAGSGSDSYIWNEPCYDSIVQFMQDHLVDIIGVAAGFALLEVFGIVFASCVCRLAANREYSGLYA